MSESLTELNNNYVHNNQKSAMMLRNLNNNKFDTEYRKGSLSSASSCQSDISDDVKLLSRRASSQDIGVTDKSEESLEFKRFRSMSDGSTIRTENCAEPFELCPSLPDTVLEKMGLRGDGPRERLNDDELEQKFTRLALAFAIDSATIRDRCDRQRRYRDQTESNLLNEIEKLIQKVHRIQPLCVDFETTELLSALLTQVDIVMRAFSLAAISAERYGAVQLEERLTESVSLMISHVELLKQQRDSARKHLQYTKRVLQDTNISSPTSPTGSHKPSIFKEKLIGRRRASIATIIQPDNLDFIKIDKKCIARRISDMSLRATSLTRNSRPSRLELSAELNKIKEGMVETDVFQSFTRQDDSDGIDSNDNSSSPDDNLIEEIKPLQRPKFNNKFERIKYGVEERYNKWTEDGTIHEICCFCALICFSISILLMVNIIIEYEYSKRGINNTSYFFWHWNFGLNENQVVTA